MGDARLKLLREQNVVVVQIILALIQSQLYMQEIKKSCQFRAKCFKHVFASAMLRLPQTFVLVSSHNRR